MAAWQCDGLLQNAVAAALRPLPVCHFVFVHCRERLSFSRGSPALLPCVYLPLIYVPSAAISFPLRRTTASASAICCQSNALLTQNSVLPLPLGSISTPSLPALLWMNLPHYVCHAAHSPMFVACKMGPRIPGCAEWAAKSWLLFCLQPPRSGLLGIWCRKDGNTPGMPEGGHSRSSQPQLTAAQSPPPLPQVCTGATWGPPGRCQHWWR